MGKEQLMKVLPPQTLTWGQVHSASEGLVLPPLTAEEP